VSCGDYDVDATLEPAERLLLIGIRRGSFARAVELRVAGRRVVFDAHAADASPQVDQRVSPEQRRAIFRLPLDEALAAPGRQVELQVDARILFVMGYGNTQVWKEAALSTFRVAFHSLDERALTAFRAYRNEVADVCRQQKVIERLLVEMNALAKDPCPAAAHVQIHDRFDKLMQQVDANTRAFNGDVRGPAAVSLEMTCNSARAL
jgi:hypothetical protein